ncbi:MAG: rhomboid family intramembrane serine protease [Methylocystaceae bacterium]
MIPLYDTIPGRYRPVMTLTIITINVVIFFMEITLPPSVLDQLISVYGFTPSVLTTSRHFISLFTAMFLHGGWMHIIGNMWALWLFGNNVEDRMGPWRFLLFYLVTGFLASLTHYYINPLSNVPVVGASGAIAGVMGAYFILYPRARVVTLIPIIIIPWFVEIPAFIYLGFWVISQIFSGTMSLVTAAAASTVAFWAHVGGFAGGMFLHRFFFSPSRNRTGRAF